MNIYKFNLNLDKDNSVYDAIKRSIFYLNNENIKVKKSNIIRTNIDSVEVSYKAVSDYDKTKLRRIVSRRYKINNIKVFRDMNETTEY